MDDILDGKYVSVQTALFQRRRMGRTADDISGCESVLSTVENKLTSLVKHPRKHLEEMLKASPTPAVIKEAGNCLDLEDILEKKETTEVKVEREKSLGKVMKKAKYGEEDVAV